MFGVSTNVYLNTVIYAYFVPVIGLIFLLCLIRKNHLFSKKQSTLFKQAVYINLVLIMLTAADFLLSNGVGEYIWIFRRFTSACHFSLAPLLPYMLLKLYSRKKLSWYLYLPIGLNAIVCIISAFYKTVFFISTNNKYDRGPLFFLPVIVTIFYVVLLTANPIIAHRQGKRQEMYYLSAIIATFLLAMALEVLFYFNCLEYGASAIGLIMYYLLQNIHYFSSDPLTGAYNRQMYNHMLENINKTPNNIFALIDINDFKKINDEQGHEAGDKALILFVSILNDHFDNIANIYRIGGDEFMVVSLKSNMTNFLHAIDDARKTALENSLRFAYGIAEHHAGDDVDELLREVDKSMYKAKSEMKTILEDAQKDIVTADYII